MRMEHVIKFGDLYQINGRWNPGSMITVYFDEQKGVLMHVDDVYMKYRDYAVYVFEDDRVYLSKVYMA